MVLRVRESGTTVHFGLQPGRTLWIGLDTTADAGVALLSNGLEALTGTPPLDWLPSVSRINGAVWQGGALPSGAAIRGIPGSI